MNLSGPVAVSAAYSRPADAMETALIPCLQDGLARLNACAAEVFLALGGALQSVATQAREVAGLSKSAISLGAAGQSDESMGKLQLMLGDAIQVQALGRMSREKLHEVFGHLKHCQAPLSHLMKLPSVLRTVGMLYRIEASRLEGASIKGVTINVSSLTADMDEMGRQIGERVATVGSEGARLAQLFQTGTEHMDRVEERERGEATSLIQQTSAVIASFRARQKAANEAARKIDQQYGDMRLASDRIVMSLQSEDMARQRIEHVQEALAQIASGVEAGGLQGGDADILMLQRSQLLSTRPVGGSDRCGARRSASTGVTAGYARDGEFLMGVEDGQRRSFLLGGAEKQVEFAVFDFRFLSGFSPQYSVHCRFGLARSAGDDKCGQ